MKYRLNLCLHTCRQAKGSPLHPHLFDLLTSSLLHPLWLRPDLEALSFLGLLLVVLLLMVLLLIMLFFTCMTHAARFLLDSSLGAAYMFAAVTHAPIAYQTLLYK
jgi:hypothetical protein